MPFKFIEEIAIADIAFEATAPTLDRLFEEAGMAASDIMVDPKTVKPALKKTLKLSANTVENLMYDFLSELIYLPIGRGWHGGKRHNGRPEDRQTRIKEDTKTLGQYRRKSYVRFFKRAYLSQGHKRFAFQQIFGKGQAGKGVDAVVRGNGR